MVFDDGHQCTDGRFASLRADYRFFIDRRRVDTIFA
jgi:hypothetical protein